MCKRIYLATVLIIFAVLFAHVFAWATPMVIDYQGLLLDDNGSSILVNGDKLTTFSIYDAAIGGNLLWTEQQNVNFNDGYFSVELGAVTSLPADLFDSDVRYLEIFIPNTVTTRKALNSKPYAIKANDADTLGGEDPLFYAEATHTHEFTEFTGQVSDAQVPDSITIDNAGIADFALKAGDADTVDGKHANGFLDTSANTQTKTGGVNINGKVGIGTKNPKSLLNIDSGGNSPVVIRGDANRLSANTVLLALQGYWNGTRVAGCDLQTGGDTINKDAGRIKFRTAEDAQTGLKDRLVIDEHGNVGIGTTGTIKERLEVSGTVKATAFIGSAAGLTDIPFDTDWAEDKGNLYRETGNVGIGTNTPAAPLHVSGNSIMEGTLNINTHQSGMDILDQSQEIMDSTTLIDNDWQSFTAGLDGILTRIEVLSNEGVSWGSITLTIYEGEGASGDFLYDSQYNIGQAPQGGVIAFDIPIEAGLMLSSGSQYTFQIDTGLIWFDFDDPYAGGQSSLSSSLDIWFRTYVRSGYNPGGTVTVTEKGYVGIGTTSPAGLLDVGGGHLVIDPNTGNVGINTQAPSEKLEVAGTVMADQFIGDGSGLSGIMDTQIPDDITINYASTAGDANTLDGKHASEFLDTSANIQTKVGGLNTNGNVGIGTTEPKKQLDVRGEFLLGNVGLIETDGGDNSINIGSSGDFRVGNLNWSSNGGDVDSDRFVVKSNGNVGIGTTSPETLLHIKSSGLSPRVKFEAVYGEMPILELQGGEYRSQDCAAIVFKGIGGAVVGQIDSVYNKGGLRFFSGNSPVMHIYYGNVGIGTTSPSYKLHVDGTAYATGAAGALSDLRHKKNISDLSLDALDVVNELHPVTFEWKEPQDSGMEGTQLGFIAQEVEEVLPEAILTQDNEEQTKGLKYNVLIPVLTKAIQEQQSQVEELKAYNEVLIAENLRQRAQIDELMTRISALEAAIKP